MLITVLMHAGSLMGFSSSLVLTNSDKMLFDPFYFFCVLVSGLATRLFTFVCEAWLDWVVQ